MRNGPIRPEERQILFALDLNHFFLDFNRLGHIGSGDNLNLAALEPDPRPDKDQRSGHHGADGQRQHAQHRRERGAPHQPGGQAPGAGSVHYVHHRGHAARRLAGEATGQDMGKPGACPAFLVIGGR